MLVKNPKFEISAVSPKQYPKNGLPEIVLVGKSNVGKSSFVNTMINRKKLAEEYQYEEENNKEKTEITTPLERGLLDEYENILGIRVSVDKEFFSIGGDSLNALKLIRKINEKYNIVITIKDLYENASVRKLAKRIIEKTEDYNEGIL